MAAGLTVYSTNLYLRADMEPFKLTLDWTGDADVALSKGIAAALRDARMAAGLCAPFPQRIKGKISKIETIPGASGDKSTYIPAGTYGVTLLDANGYDILDGTGAARSISAAETVVFENPVPVDEDLTLTIATTATADQIAGRGAFTGAATGWTLGAGWAYGTNNIAKSTGGSGTAADDTFAAVSGRVYDVTYTIAGWSAAANRGVKVTCGGVDGTTRTANGTYTDTITATGAGGLIFTPTGTDAANVALTLDAVTVKYNDPKGRLIIFVE